MGTMQTDDPSLTTRLEGSEGKDPTRIILDEDLAISEKAKLLRLDSDSDTVLFTGRGVPESKKKRIENMGARVIETTLENDRIDLNALMVQLGDMGIMSLLIEGGSGIFSSALSAGIVDKVVLFYAPKILGGDDGIPMFRGRGPALMSEGLSVKDIRYQRIDDDIMVEGYL